MLIADPGERWLESSKLLGCQLLFLSRAKTVGHAGSIRDPYQCKIRATIPNLQIITASISYRHAG